MCDGRWVVSCACRWLWGRAKQLAVHQHYHLLPGAGLAHCQTSAQIIDGSVQTAAEVCQSVQTLWQTYKVQSILQLCVQSGPEAITANNNGINKWTWNDSSNLLHINTTLYIPVLKVFKSYNGNASSHFVFYQNESRYFWYWFELLNEPNGKQIQPRITIDFLLSFCRIAITYKYKSCNTKLESRTAGTREVANELPR